MVRQMNLEIGTLLMIETQGVANPVKGVFVGMVPGQYLIVQSPSAPVLADQLREGGRLVVRYLFSGVVYGFKTSVKMLLNVEGQRLLFITYPLIVEEHNLRRYNRIEFHLPATIRIGNLEYQGDILDISLAGCGFNLKHESIPGIVMDEKVELCFRFPGLEDSTNWSGVVRNITIGKFDAKLGIQFENIDADIAGRIEAYIKSVTEYFE